MNEDAIEIAKMIMNTDTEHRGELLQKVAELLEGKAQFFTARCIAMAADRYGYMGKG